MNSNATPLNPALEDDYNVRPRRPDYDSKVVPDWTQRSISLREDADCRLDLAYGNGARERFDFFPASDRVNRPTVIYFHGGYWHRGDKSMYSFIAEPFIRNGVSVIIMNYSLCPAVSISDISRQARQAVAWLWRHAQSLGISADKLYVMGHSAGGHLTAMLMGTDWPNLGADLPKDVLKGGIPVSGLFDLEPLRFTSFNEVLGLDQTEAREQSPMNHPPLTNAPQLVVCGSTETKGFLHQSDIYARAFSTPERYIERYSVPGCDHIDVVSEIARESSILFQKLMRFMSPA